MKARKFNRILVATDGSEPAQAAVSVATSLAEASGGSIHVVHVWSLEVHHRYGVWDVETRAEATGLIDSAVDSIRSHGIEGSGEILHADNDHVAAVVADAARKFDADLLVVGSRGLSDWHSLVSAHSVSHQLLTKVDCPVLIVRGPSVSPAHTGQRVLLAVAGGDDVEPSVAAAAAAASAPGSSVLVVHVPITIITMQGYSYVESEEEMEATVAQAKRLLLEAGLPAGSLITHGGPVAQTVIEAAARWGADIIVIGSTRMGDLGSLVLGSVTHSLLHTSDRPVLVAERIAR